MVAEGDLKNVEELRAKAVTELRLSPEGYPINAQGRRICGAKRHNRWGVEGYCQSPFVMPNGRCIKHGGVTPRGPENKSWKTGKYSKYLPPNLLDAYHRAIEDRDLLTLKEEIALVDSLILDRLTQIDNSETDARWLKLRQIYDAAVRANRMGDAREASRQFKAMAELLQAGAGQAEARQELLELIERRRKLVETERRLMVEMGLMLSVTEVAGLLAIVLHIIERHVDDQKVRFAIGEDLRRFVLARTGEQAIPSGRNGRTTIEIPGG